MYINRIRDHFQHCDLWVKLTVAISKAIIKFVPFNTNESVIFYTVSHADVYMYMHFILEYNFDKFFVLSFPRAIFLSLQDSFAHLGVMRLQ